MYNFAQQNNETSVVCNFWFEIKDFDKSVGSPQLSFLRLIDEQTFFETNFAPFVLPPQAMKAFSALVHIHSFYSFSASLDIHLL